MIKNETTQATNNSEGSTMGTKRERIIAAAIAMSYNVRDDGKGLVAITRGKTVRSYGILLWEDNTATRCDVQLDSAMAIRTEKEIINTLEAGSK